VVQPPVAAGRLDVRVEKFAQVIPDRLITFTLTDKMPPIE
jgi:hypothetical protein